MIVIVQKNGKRMWSMSKTVEDLRQKFYDIQIEEHLYKQGVNSRQYGKK